MIITAKTRNNGQEIQLDTSDEAFKALPQEWFREYRTRDLVEDWYGRVFLIIGVGKHSCNRKYCNLNGLMIIYGYLENETGVSCYDSQKKCFQKIKE
jgi:hypothetical protein